MREILRGLKQIGVRIALDDFGTGFSSLSYLRKFPFDKIKIDRSFIIELLEEDEAGAVVKAITDLAAALDMETTAEGVEEVAQLDALRAHGCTTVQGYLFSRPVPACEVPRLLSLWRRGLLDLESMITFRRPLAEINDGFDDLRAGRGIRTLITI